MNHPLDPPDPTGAADGSVVDGSESDRQDDPSADTDGSVEAADAAVSVDAAGSSGSSGSFGSSGTDGATVIGSHRKLGLVLVIAAVILIADQITKLIAVANLTPGVSPKILGGLVYFSLIRNPGAAFSIGTGMTWILAVVACAVVVVIIRMAAKLRSGLWASCLGLILGGALGNLSDRIFRSPGVMRGHVVDFVSVFGPNARYFPVFNLADSAITIGGILLVITALLGIEFDGTRVRRGHRQPPDGSETGSSVTGTPDGSNV